MSRLVCLSLICLSVCAGPALAQVGPPPIYPADILNYVVPWPASVTAGSFLCIEPGDYDDDGVPDAAVLRGTKPVILLDPAIFGASLVLPCDAYDIACFAGGGTNGEDVLATVGAGGLTLWDFDPLLEGEPQTFTPHSVGALPWVGALQVVGGNLDGDADSDLLGVGANGRTIQFLVNQGSGAFTSLTPFLAAEPVRQLGLVEWDGDAAPEVWALTTKALDVYELSGLRVANYRNFSSTGQVDGVAVLRHPQPDSPTKDRIVWATRVSPMSLNQVLLVLYQGGYEPNPIVLTNSNVVALATGDYDHDGDSDLIMSDKNLHVVQRVDNQKAVPPGQPPEPPPAHTFEGYPTGAANYWAGPSGPNAAPNLCTLPWIDWDNDAELDLMCAAEPESWILLYPGVDPQGPEVDPDPDDLAVVAGHPSFGSMQYIAASETPCLESRQFVGLLDISLDNAWNLSVNDIDDINVIDLIVYRQAAPSGCPVNDAVRHHRYGLETAAVVPNNPDKFLIHVLIPEAWDPPLENGGTFNSLYFCQVRVILNADLPNQLILRTYVGGFTSDVAPFNSNESWYALMQLPSSWLGSIPRNFNYCPPPYPEPGSVNGAGFRPLSRMPPFAAGQSPNPGPPTLWTDYYNP